MGNDTRRPNAVIRRAHNDDGSRYWDDIEYSCPICGRYIGSYGSEVGCKHCKIFYDWGDREPTIKVVKTIQW